MQIKTLNADIKAKAAQLVALEANVAAKAAHIDALNAVIKEKDSQIEILKGKNAEKNTDEDESITMEKGTILLVNRVIEPPVVRSGGQASVTYELYNSGSVELSEIRIQENISKTPKIVKSLAPGERTTVNFTSRIGNADLKSNATITFKIESESKTQGLKIDDEVIAVAKPNLKFELSSLSDTVNVGEKATLIITFTNEGNVSYSNVTVTDAKAGELLSGISIPAGETVREEKQFILTESVSFKATATLPDNTGETKKLTSNELHIGINIDFHSLKLSSFAM